MSSLGLNYEVIVGDFKRDEKALIDKLEQIEGHSKQDKKGKGMKAAVEATEVIRSWDEQIWSHEKLLEKFLSSKENGITSQRAEELLHLLGENVLTERKGTPWYILLLKELTGFFALLLWAGAILCIIGYALDTSSSDNLYLGIVLFIVVILTGLFSYYQGSKAASLMADFKNFIPKEANVIRDGKKITIEARYLVPGDIVFINLGDNIPADVILLEAVEMKVNNASLTGESEDLLRKVNKCEPNIFESPNVAFFGTMCTAGKGMGMVIRTADSTVIGRIAGLASSAEQHETTLAVELERFIKYIALIAIVTGIVFFVAGFCLGYPVITNIIFAIGIIVANVPEGLLATVTLCLAVCAQRMAEKNVFVKNLESVETLGSTTCICSDKTGTLTQNRMSVSNIFCNGKVISAAQNYEIFKRLQEVAKDPNDVTTPAYDFNESAFKNLALTIALSTTASFFYDPSAEQIRIKASKILKTKASSLPKEVKQSENPSLFAKYQEAREILLKEEEERPYTKRGVEGDASETGLIKFVQPLMMDGKYGCYQLGGLKSVRDAYPVVKTEAKQNVEIPFSSDIKFNCMVRDMTQDGQQLTIFLKGAPERVINRCSTILINGQDQPIDANMLKEINEANERFGAMGERVLAFARLQLNPKIFTKEPLYPFDVSDWKVWKDAKQFDKKIPGWFPMWNLQLIGLVSLNDPPRHQVDIAVSKCRTAGIKVIMVTGDQPPTAAAIAHKVNIITDPSLEYNTILKNNPEISHQEAFEKCQAIVIHGDELARVHAEEEALDDNEIEKGRKIMDWIRKPEVVFARTTPSQKLLIVDACQRLGHIVAVTGDGVNDSPAIKKANIGIAMGSGSDVAKNAADILLLDDNFSSIVNGIEQGRLIFDNLKKSIAYTITHNIPEIWPFIYFIIFSVPLPLTTVLILTIDLGADMVPAITYAYEHSELDIMDRQPRNNKRDFMVGKKLLSHAYLEIGMIEIFGGCFIYYYIMNDYGFSPVSLFGLDPELGYYPHPSDVYDPNLPGNGNSNWGNPVFKAQLQWTKTSLGKIDLRLFYTERPATNWSKCRWTDGDANEGPYWYRYSNFTDSQICYTNEALKHAQTGYLAGIVICQIANCIATKTRALSISQQGFDNRNQTFGMLFSICLIVCLTYVPFLNVGFQTRMLASPHFLIPGFCWSSTVLFYDEIRKIFLRSGLRKEEGRIKYIGWVARNQYY